MSNSVTDWITESYVHLSHDVIICESLDDDGEKTKRCHVKGLLINDYCIFNIETPDQDCKDWAQQIISTAITAHHRRRELIKNELRYFHEVVREELGFNKLDPEYLGVYEACEAYKLAAKLTSISMSMLLHDEGTTIKGEIDVNHTSVIEAMIVEE